MKNKLLLVLPLLVVNLVSAETGSYGVDLENRWATEVFFGTAEGNKEDAEFSGIRQSFHIDKNFAFDVGYRTSGRMNTYYAYDDDKMFNTHSTSQKFESFEFGVHADYSFIPALSVEVNGGFAFLNVDNGRVEHSVNRSSDEFLGLGWDLPRLIELGLTPAQISEGLSNAQHRWAEWALKKTGSSMDRSTKLYFGFAAKYHFTDNAFVSARYHKVDGIDYDDYSIGIGLNY